MIGIAQNARTEQRSIRNGESAPDRRCWREDGFSTTVGAGEWFTVASANWSPTTVRQTSSLLNRQVHPYLDSVFVADLTTGGIDNLYSHLLTSGGADEQPSKPGTLKRVHVALSSEFSHR